MDHPDFITCSYMEKSIGPKGKKLCIKVGELTNCSVKALSVCSQLFTSETEI